MGPSYANLFVGFIENKFFSNYHGPKPDLYKRYIDDCVGATSSSREELNLFINSVNSFHPALKYTWEISENSLAFLDIKLSINDNGLSTSVHYKPTDSHNYLLHSSIVSRGKWLGGPANFKGVGYCSTFWSVTSRLPCIRIQHGGG